MDEAARLIHDDPRRAAQIYLTHEPSKTLDAAAIAACSGDQGRVRQRGPRRAGVRRLHGPARRAQNAAAKLEGDRRAGAVEFAKYLARSAARICSLARRTALDATCRSGAKSLPNLQNPPNFSRLSSHPWEDAMPKRRIRPSSSRRNFLKGAGLVGAAPRGHAAGRRQRAAGRAADEAEGRRSRPAADRGRDHAAGQRPGQSDDSSGGDFMVDVLKSLGIEYLAINCASSYRGLHEAVINHGNNKPEIITCVHEDIAVHMAQGYAKIEGKPIAMACHGVVGLQHATMAMYNAWCDRVPVLVIGGNIMEADKRAPGAEWVHSGVDIGALVREFTKWDDQPASLQHFAESAVRAYKIATTPPMGPVFLALDAELQENPIPDADSLRIPKFAPVVPPQGDSGAIAEAAKMLVEAQNPVIICDRVARTPAGMANLVELAETLQCGVIDNAGRMNFPSRHPLNQSFRRGDDRPGRRHPRDRDERPLGRAHRTSATASCAVAPGSPSRAPRSSRSACAIFI